MAWHGFAATKIGTMEKLPMSARSVVRGVVVGLWLVGAGGCGDSPDPIRPLPIPSTDSPQNLMLRFKVDYESRIAAQYAALFTTDYRFYFSANTDAGLASQYPQGWGLSDELTSATNLFNGFVDGTGTPQAAAQTITMHLENGANFADDQAHADSSAYYKTYIAP